MKGHYMKAEELYNRCKEKEEEAWAYAYNYVFTFLKKTTGTYQDIEDITQGTILYYLGSGLSKLESPKAFKQWLRLKAKALFIDRYRHRTKHSHEPLEPEDENGQQQDENPTIEPAHPKVEEALFLEKTLVIIKKSLKAISVECKNLLERYFLARFLGEKGEEIALELGMPASTVRVKIYRCHQKLLQQPEYRGLIEEYNIT